VSLKIVVFASGDFAAPAFRGLYAEHRILALYTSPDSAKRKRGCLVTQIAQEHGTPVFQPEDVNGPEELARLQSLGADLFLAIAYGQILSPALLGIPPRGGINVHASLLPKYRGASPIQYAILNGDAETGVTIIQMTAQLLAGPIYAADRISIGPEETAGELEHRLAELSAPLTLRVLEQIEAGQGHPISQIESRATLAPKLSKDFGLIDWKQSATEIARRVRALQSWPTAFSFLQRELYPPQRVILQQVSTVVNAGSRAPGTIVSAQCDHLLVQTGEGLLSVLRIQPEGGEAMEIADFLRGTKISVGDRLGPLLTLREHQPDGGFQRHTSIEELPEGVLVRTDRRPRRHALVFTFVFALCIATILQNPGCPGLVLFVFGLAGIWELWSWRRELRGFPVFIADSRTTAVPPGCATLFYADELLAVETAHTVDNDGESDTHFVQLSLHVESEEFAVLIRGDAVGSPWAVDAKFEEVAVQADRLAARWRVPMVRVRNDR
jgi:methionyl-tRNA formyltransferase